MKDGKRLSRIIVHASFLIALAAAAYLFATAGYTGLWADELATAYFTDPNVPIATLWQERMLYDSNAPLYYLLMHFWMQVFGSGDLSMRAPSVLAFLVCILVVYYGYRRGMIGREAGWFVLFLTGSFYVWRYSHEARAYLLTLAGTLNMSLLAVHFVTAAQERRPISKSALVAFALCAFVTSFLHFFGFLFAGCLMLCLVVFLRKEDRKFILFLFVLGTALGLSMGAWLYASWAHAISMRIPVWWIPFEPVKALGRFVYYSLGRNWLLVSAVTVAALFSFQNVARHRGVRLLVATSALVYGVTLLLSVAAAPVTHYRYLVVLLPAFAYVAAHALADASTPKICRALTVGALALSIACLAPRVFNERQDWRAATRFVSNLCATSPGDGMIPVLPPLEGPFRSLPWTYAFSHYAPELYGKLVPANRESIEQALQSDCPIVLWVLRKYRPGADELQTSLGMSLDNLKTVRFRGHDIIVKSNWQCAKPENDVLDMQAGSI